MCSCLFLESQLTHLQNGKKKYSPNDFTENSVSFEMDKLLSRCEMQLP